MGILVYIYSHVSGVRGLLLSYHPFYFLSASWTLAGAAEPESVVILISSARTSTLTSCKGSGERHESEMNS